MPQLHATALLNRLQAKARLRHLQVLVKLAELGNLKRCAEALSLSQPAITHLLADLESLLEVALFDRHARGVRPTPYGDALLPLARRMLAALAEGSETLVAMRQAGAGTVRVAAITGAISGLLVVAVPEFARTQSGVHVEVREESLDVGLQALVRGEVDLLVARQRGTLPAGFRFVPLLEEHYVIACGVDHPLAGRIRRSWLALSKETWLLSPVGTSARAAFDAVMEGAGARPQVSPVVTRVSAMTWAMLASQTLLTLVPEGVVRQLLAAGQLARVHGPELIPMTPLGMIVAESGLLPATGSFVDFLGRNARALAGR